MNHSVISALIAAAVSIFTLCAAPFVKKQLEEKEKSKEKTESMEQGHRRQLFHKMIEIRKLSRGHVEYFADIQRKIENREYVDWVALEERLRGMYMYSEHMEVIIAVGLYYPGVVRPFLEYCRASERYVSAVKACRTIADPPTELIELLDSLKVLRGELVDAMKEAASELGYRILIADEDGGSSP